MNQVIAIHNQNLLDIAIQEYGDVRAVFDLALVNDISITELLSPGQELLLPESQFVDGDILAYYKANNIKPATASPASVAEIKPTGIGYMIIEKTFKIK